MCTRLVLLQVAGGEDIGVLEEEWAEVVQDIVDAEVGGEGQLRGIECGNGTISSSTAVYYSEISAHGTMANIRTDTPDRWGNSNGIVEKETKGSVGRVTAFISEKVVHYVFDDGDHGTARRIYCSAAAIGAHGAFGTGG